jgi:hypothetical protein
MSLRLKILIAAFALAAASLGVVGDGLFLAMGLPSGSGRIVVAAVLSAIGIAWFGWSHFRWRTKDFSASAGAPRNNQGDKLG